ncbi:MAG: acyltransferase [Gemmatimonadota bacterium]|nr:acyltransferase [Gemmatimonadota bacterium]
MTAAPVTVTMDRSAGEVDRSLERGHILALDGLRGIAILLVIFCHFVSNLHITADGWAWPFVAIAHAGWAGVDLFFVLSGFLITGILVDARGSPSYFKAFYARRALRILPAYYGFLFAIFVVLPLLHLGAGDNYMLARQHQGWYWFHLTNIMMALGELPGHGPYPSTLFWSLAVEEQFYFIWPAIVALSSPNKLRKICLGGVLLCVVLRIVGGLAGVSELTLSVLPITRGDTLFVGGLLAIEYRRGTLERYVRMAKITTPLALLALVALTLVYGRLDYLDRGTAMFGSIAIMVLGASAVVIGITAQDSRYSGVLRSGLLRFFGRYSYALYIVHTAVLAGMNRYRPFAALPSIGGLAFPAQTLWLIVYVAMSTAVAMLSWHLVEKHFLRLKIFFPYRPKSERAVDYFDPALTRSNT